MPMILSVPFSLRLDVQTATQSWVRRDSSATTAHIAGAAQLSRSRQEETGCTRLITSSQKAEKSGFLSLCSWTVRSQTNTLKSLFRFSLFVSFSFMLSKLISYLLPFIFYRFSKLNLEGRDDNNKHASWQTCIRANRFLEGCLIIKLSQKSNSKHALFYF